ncbi:ATP adenylyltransferase-domain-containing protein [Xylariomycetidae sp. FL0641]|nr:ATP adenylyltransferase-domain-containing protein [Xylariomycetidae sp. FL0641]
MADDDSMTLRPAVPARLPALVKAAFAKAKANGDLTYYPTQVAVLSAGAHPFQLRFSPALASKPKAAAAAPSPPAGSGDQKPYDPFASPSPALRVAALPPAHTLVLNKFAVVPEHFILATAAWAPQTHVLAAGDLAAAWACVDAYHRDGGGELFVFFNSGEHSGASQPHRHLQLLPVACMRAGLPEEGGRWDVLADRLAAGAGAAEAQPDALPFAVFAAEMDAQMSAEARHALYVSLYRRAARAAGVAGEVPAAGEARVSYNLAMTRTAMAVCPRVAEGAGVRDARGREAGFVALNGTVLAGTALVKNQAEWDAVRANPDALQRVLAQIGVPPGRDGRL